ncbi:hypothetical protein [Tolypothrix sp. NIES-4075]|nr:hypothetical protein [Tolypothrix sp. NIES-4075]
MVEEFFALLAGDRNATDAKTGTLYESDRSLPTVMRSLHNYFIS